MTAEVKSYRTFRRRVAHNTRVLKNALRKGKSLVTIIDQLYTWTTKPGELHSSVLIRNAHDIIPAAYLGLLVNVNATGIDAFKMNIKNQRIDYELKTAEIRGNKIWQGIKGGLYIGNSVSRDKFSGITSQMTASYNFSTKNIINSKHIKTVLMVCDTSGRDGYFDAWELDGSLIAKFLKPKLGNVTISLGTFMREGKQAKTVVDMEGFSNWRQRIADIAPVKLVGTTS
jgi:hypothetical protein